LQEEAGADRWPGQEEEEEDGRLQKMFAARWLAQAPQPFWVLSGGALIDWVRRCQFNRHVDWTRAQN